MSRKNRKAKIKARNEAQKMGLVESIKETNQAIKTANVNTPAGKSGIHKDYIIDDYAGYTGINSGRGFKNCSHYPRKIIELGQLIIYGATKTVLDYDVLMDKDLIVNVSGTAVGNSLGAINSTIPLIRGPVEFDVLKSFVKPVRELILDWPDGGVFPVGILFWRKLYDICVENKYFDVVFTCLGGHGRTGTAVAAMILAHTQLKPDFVTERIHQVYCDGAIETWSQDEYLEMLEIERDNDRTVEQINVDFKWGQDKPVTVQKIAASAAFEAGTTAAGKQGNFVPKCYCSHSVYIHNEKGHCMFVDCGCLNYLESGTTQQIVLPIEDNAGNKKEPSVLDCLCSPTYVCLKCETDKGVKPPIDGNPKWKYDYQLKGWVPIDQEPIVEDNPAQINRTVVAELLTKINQKLGKGKGDK